MLNPTAPQEWNHREHRENSWQSARGAAAGGVASRVGEGVPLLGVEPSCILTFADEWRELAPGPETTGSELNTCSSAARTPAFDAPETNVARLPRCATASQSGFAAAASWSPWNASSPVHCECLTMSRRCVALVVGDRGRGADGNASAGAVYTVENPASVEQSADFALHAAIWNDRSAVKRFGLNNTFAPATGSGLMYGLSIALTWTRSTLTGSVPARSTVTFVPSTTTGPLSPGAA